MPRANISLDKAVFDNFAAQAMLGGKTLFAFTNEWLEAAAKISAEGGDAKDIFKLWRSVSVLKQVDAITLPSDFVDQMIVKLYERDKSDLMAAFARLGSKLVGILRIAAEDIDDLSNLARDFTIFVPIKKFEIKKKDGDSIEVDIVGAGRKRESTECSFEFMKAVLAGYRYEVLSHELTVGTIRITATKRGAK